MMKLLKENGLSISLFLIFVIILLFHSITGYIHNNEDLQEHYQPEITYTDYITGSEFLSSVFENWESEFLQMGMFIIMTVFLFQKGSAESKELEGEEVDKDTDSPKNLPHNIRDNGFVKFLYKNSLSLAFFILFLISFLLHWIFSYLAYCQEQLIHTTSCISQIEYLTSSKLWFESFQNWQSEFLAVFAIVVLSIFLRQKGSAESKPLTSSNIQTGK